MSPARTNGEGKPIVALDIDNTLGNYHLHFLRFAEGWYGHRMPDPERMNPGLPLWEFMGVTRASYRECKLAYRQGGMKRSMPVYEGADRLTHLLCELGAEVWLCTTRPYLRLDNIDPDTREWLRRNGIQYHGLLTDNLNEEKGSKYAELSRQAGHRVAVIVDDLPELLQVARKHFPSTPLLLRDQPYNRYVSALDAPIYGSRVRDCLEIFNEARDAIEIWRKANDAG